MRFLLLLLPAIVLAQNAQDEDFRFELTASAWQTGISGTVQSGGLALALHNDLALGDTWTFFGKVVFKPARRHRLIVEGSPYYFGGTTSLSRTITYDGRTYTINAAVKSNASLAYVFGGYQFDLISRARAHFGLEAGGAYLNGTGTISTLTNGISGTRTEIIGLPLAGAEFRVFFGPAHMNLNGEAKGMSFDGYGDYFQGVVNVGAGFRQLMFQVGYQYLNADIHENRALNPAGISPVIQGPIFSVQLRLP